jgi:hypothetical protein
MRAAVVRRDLELADRRYFAGDAKGARRKLERSLASLPRGGDRAQVLLELGSVIWTQGDVTGLKLFDQALEEAETPSLRARIPPTPNGVWPNWPRRAKRPGKWPMLRSSRLRRWATSSGGCTASWGSPLEPSSGR